VDWKSGVDCWDSREGGLIVPATARLNKILFNGQSFCTQTRVAACSARHPDKNTNAFVLDCGKRFFQRGSISGELIFPDGGVAELIDDLKVPIAPATAVDLDFDAESIASDLTALLARRLNMKACMR
jgi:hypothetical protein